MKIAIYSIFLAFLISNCSEGDIIDNDVNFDATLENCSNSNDNTFVFYKIDANSNQSLSANFTSPTFDITPEVNDISVTTPTVIPLNSDSNQLIYRQFNETITGSDYFCSSIPPSNVSIAQEMISAEGSIEISYQELDPESNTQRRYTRTIIAKNVSLEGNGISIRRESLFLGSDTIAADVSIDFGGSLLICPENTPDTFTVYTFNDDINRAIHLNFADTAFEINPSVDNIVEENIDTILLNDTNILTYREFDTAIPDTDTATEFFCNNNLPSDINITRTLNSTGGSIEISYEEIAPIDMEKRFSRTFTLKNLVISGTGSPIQIESLVLGSDTIPK